LQPANLLRTFPAIAVTAPVAGGAYLASQGRTIPVVRKLTSLSFAIKLFLFATGRPIIDRPPLFVETATERADPSPRAPVVTAMVVASGMTAPMTNRSQRLEPDNAILEIVPFERLP
jgi:multisubunit Na+/H+ antiporter MnhC subunit